MQAQVRIAEGTGSVQSQGQFRSHAGPQPHPKFYGDNTFQIALNKRADAYFARTGLRRRDCAGMYAKTALLLAATVAAYVALVFFTTSWWVGVPLAVVLGLCMAGIGMNVQHDGSHQAYSSRGWVNKLMSLTLELIGGSSYIWHYQHGVLHHTWVNVAGHDSDIDVGIFGRLSPHQRRRSFHRFQHLYMWPLYGLMAVRWHLFADFYDVIVGKVGGHPIPRPRGWDLVVFVLGKVYLFAVAFVVPMMFHPWWVVLAFYGIVTVVVGVVLSVVFQLAHAVDSAEFVVADEETNRIENAWAIHQAESTVDFARQSKMAAFLLGGLNYQVEHHLFPRICHVHFPALSKEVEATCKEFGVRYNDHGSFWQGVASHYRWLREMGRPEVVPRGVPAAG